MRAILSAALLLAAVACSAAGAAMALAACGSVEKGAANDPRKCELDPNCANKRGNYNDCATACADNSDCMQRCHQVTGQ